MILYQDAEKFIKDIYWSNSHDSRSKIDIPKLIEEKLIEDDKQKDPEYYNHRDGVVHVSSLGKCLRGVIYDLLGYERDNKVDARKLGVFKAGNLFEDFVIDSLGDRVIHKQREYEYKYKSIILVGRSDYTINDDGIMRVGENKSVHSDSFWQRQREGTLIAWHNQIQLQVYMWLERILNGNEWEGIFTYISKDDCTIVQAPVKFNQRIIDEIVIPTLDIINEAYEKKDPNIAPVPDMVVYSETKNQYQKNWLATYCEHHEKCAGKGWILEATNLVSSKNKELKESMKSFVASAKKTKPKIEVVGEVEPTDEQ